MEQEKREMVEETQELLKCEKCGGEVFRRIWVDESQVKITGDELFGIKDILILDTEAMNKWRTVKRYICEACGKVYSLEEIKILASKK